MDSDLMKKLFFFAGIVGIALLAASCVMGIVLFIAGMFVVLTVFVYGIIERGGGEA
jgi:uncharacterized protein (DUF58 family)